MIFCAVVGPMPGSSSNSAAKAVLMSINSVVELTTSGTGVVMIGEASGEFPAMPCMIHVYVPDCDATYARAIASRCRIPPDKCFG